MKNQTKRTYRSDGLAAVEDSMAGVGSSACFATAGVAAGVGSPSSLAKAGVAVGDTAAGDSTASANALSPVFDFLVFQKLDILFIDCRMLALRLSLPGPASLSCWTAGGCKLMVM